MEPNNPKFWYPNYSSTRDPAWRGLDSAGANWANWKDGIRITVGDRVPKHFGGDNFAFKPKVERIGQVSSVEFLHVPQMMCLFFWNLIDLWVTGHC